MNESAAMAERLSIIDHEINQALIKAGRVHEEVQVVAVTKGQPIDKINHYLNLLNSTGRVAELAENYLQEFQKKKNQLQGSYKTVFIGRIQSNKAGLLVRNFDLIQSVDSCKIAEVLQQEALKINKVQEVFLQVNVSGDQAKGGFTSDLVKQFIIQKLSAMTQLKVSGLMTITRYYPEPEQTRNDFLALKKLSLELLQDRLTMQILKQDRLGLSMGMSQDYQIAVECGATHVRIGSAIFGARS